jgi:MFS family permease
MQQRTHTAPNRDRFRAFNALRYRDYRWYWLSGLGMAGAQNINQITIAWLVLDLTGSLGQLGMVIFFQGLPQALVAMFGGVFADRYSRKLMLQLTQIFSTITIATLAFLTLSDMVEVWMVYIASILLGVAMSLTMPARNALIRSLVPIEDAMNGVALNSIQQHASRIIFPGLAGAMIAAFDVGPTIAFSAVISATGIVCLLMVGKVHEDKLRGGTTVMRDMLEGIKYAFTTPRLKNINFMAIGIGAFGLAFMTIGAGFAREELHFSADEAGAFVMMSGIGALVGSSFLISMEIRDRYAVFVAHAVLFAGSLLLIAINPFAPASFLFMAGFGAASTGLAISAQTIYQVEVPPQYLGRVVSTFSIGGGIGQMTALPIGLLGDELGLRWPLGGVAIMLLVVVFFLAPGARARQPAPAEAVAGN